VFRFYEWKTVGVNGLNKDKKIPYAFVMTGNTNTSIVLMGKIHLYHALRSNSGVFQL